MRRALGFTGGLLLAAATFIPTIPAAADGNPLQKIDHIVVIYQEQYQIDGGKQDRYVTGSDAVGLTMGHYDTTKLPIYAYLHGPNAPHYVIADNFLPRRLRWVVPQPPGARRRPGTGLRQRRPQWTDHRLRHRHGQLRPALHGRRQRHAQQLPLLHPTGRHCAGPAAHRSR
ncbi:MAG: hypothetical protein ACRDRE_04700 [Pseudonocardiaceae bacterium]